MWCSHEWLLQCSCCGCYRFGDSNKRGGQTRQHGTLEEATNRPMKQRMNERMNEQMKEWMNEWMNEWMQAGRKGGMVFLGIGVLWYFYPGYDIYIYIVFLVEFNNYRSYLKSKCKDPWGIWNRSSEVNGTKRCCCCLDVVWLKDWLGVLEERESSLKLHLLLQKTTFLFPVRKLCMFCRWLLPYQWQCHLGGRKCLRSGWPQNDSSEPQAHGVWSPTIPHYQSIVFWYVSVH